MNITFERVVRFFIGFAALFVVGLILYNYSTLVAYLIIAIILSYLLDPVINWLQRNNLNRTFAIILTLLSVVAVIGFISTSVIPIIADQMIQLTRQLSITNIEIITKRIESQLISNYEFIPEGILSNNLSNVIEQLLDFGEFSGILGNLVNVFTNIFSAVLVIPFAAFFFLKDGSKIRRDVLRLVPNKYFESTLVLIDKVEKRLGLYFRSVFLQSILVAVSSWLTLSVAGLDNSLSVGIAVGVANTIPYFGPIIGYILSIIISIIETGDFSLVLMCLVAILIVQILDNVVFQPFLFSRSADIHPVAILFIILVGAETAGLLGMLVAIPIATTVKISINQIIWSFNNYQIFKRDVVKRESVP